MSSPGVVIKKNPPTVFILSITTAVFFSLAAFLFYMNQNEKKERLTLNGRLENAMSNQKDLEKEIKELEISSNTLETSVKFHEDTIQMLTQQIETTRTNLKQAEDEILRKQSEIEELNRRLSREHEEKAQLVKQLDKQSEDLVTLKFQLKNILKTKEELEMKAKELAEKGPVSLGTIVIKQNN